MSVASMRACKTACSAQRPHARNGATFRVASASRVAPNLARVFAAPKSALRSRRNVLKTTVAVATTDAPKSTGPPPPSADWYPDLTLPAQATGPEWSTGPAQLDVTVSGAGPAGLATAARLAKAGIKVCIIDPTPKGAWPNNYGVWMDEFEAMGLADCVDTIWDRAVVRLNEGDEYKRYLNRPYGRVDRRKLKQRLLEDCKKHGVTFLTDKVQSVEHGDGASVITTASGVKLKSVLCVDSTGHSRKLVEYDQEFNPGFQGAYGMMVDVEKHPFNVEEMLFMDWRDNHLDPFPDVKERNVKLPTFLYMMPFSDTRIFLEETSLVARPAVPFDDLKERLKIRMESLGLKVTHIEEEEYCLIPMGGVLPKFPQRVIGVGGTAGLVHPSTGYMVSRVLGAAPAVADAIIEGLAAARQAAADRGGDPNALTEAEVQKVSEGVWRALWGIERLRQREFFLFGMDVLLSLNVHQTREFFAAFFALSYFNWTGFLSSRLSFGQLLIFGIYLFFEASIDAKKNLIVQGVPGLFKMLYRMANYGKTYGL